MWLIIGDIYGDFGKIFGKNYKKYSSLLEVSEEDKVKAIGIVSRGAHHKFDEKFLNQLPNLKYIALFQIGVDNVDLDFCKKRGILVKNFISFKSVEAVAQLTVGSLIVGARYGFRLGCKLKNGIYTRQPLGYSLDGLKIGIVGFGRIGQKVYEYLKSYPVQIGVYDIMIDKIIANFPEDKDFKVFKSLSEIFDWADIISLHIPGGEENKNLINYKLLKKIFGIVNMSRPCIVNEQDLIKVLEENPKFFYVSDVVCGEPNVEKINKKLLSFDNVFIYPHIGANTIQVQQNIFRQFEEWVRGINECFK